MMSFENPLQFLISIAAFLVAIGVLVTVHEFGHYWVARRLGIRILRFSIGFGRPLWRRMIGKDDAVEFVIAAIPLGGYVKPLDERDGNVPPEEVHRSINRQPVWKRILFLLGGATFNLAFAIGCLLDTLHGGCARHTAASWVRSRPTPSQRRRQAVEDEIVAVSGRKVSTIDAALLGIVDDLVDDGSISMDVRGVDGGERALTLHAGERVAN